MSKAIVPILKRNGQIFDSYGPENDLPDDEDRYQLWLKFEPELISNNKRLELILAHNVHLFHRDNHRIVDDFIMHSREFSETRGSDRIKRIHLFPQELLSIFGIQPALVGLPPNLSAFQNLVGHLVRTGRFDSLDLDGEPRLTYLDDGKTVTLSLMDRPRLQQIFWTGRFFTPRSTEVRIQSLVFFVRWLNQNGIQYLFPDMCDLTHLILNGKHSIKLFYAYVLSRSDLNRTTLEKGDIVVNLHSWNGAPISSEADTYATSIGARTFGQNDFFVFAHNNLK